MKKSISLLLLCTLISVCALAQRSTTSSNFKGGVRAGFTTCQISADNLSGFHQFGAYVGGFANFPLSDDLKWKIQLEMDFTMKGSHSYQTSKMILNNPTYGKYSLSLGYLEVPVLLKWNFAKKFTINGKPVLNGLELEFGPMLGVNLYQREKDQYGVIVGRPQFRHLEFSGIAGIACLFKEHHGVSIRYSNSLLPVRKPDWQVIGYIKRQYNSVLMFSYFYQF